MILCDSELFDDYIFQLGRGLFVMIITKYDQHLVLYSITYVYGSVEYCFVVGQTVNPIESPA